VDQASCSMHKLIADVAVFASGQVVLVRYGRASGYDGQSGWFIPDDQLNHLEHPDDGARRILSDQLGINDVPVRLDHIESFKGNDRSWHLTFHYTADLDAAEQVQPTSSVASFAWFPLDALPDRREVAHHGWALDVLTKIAANRVTA
jgi:ADP-ribose pyrophosphatase YjhB (NUDIX family)